MSVTDADDEVRRAVRDIVGLLADGVDLDRIGVFYPVAEPYLAILEQQLDAAGLPANGPSQRSLGASAAGRTRARSRHGAPCGAGNERMADEARRVLTKHAAS